MAIGGWNYACICAIGIDTGFANPFIINNVYKKVTTSKNIYYY